MQVWAAWKHLPSLWPSFLSWRKKRNFFIRAWSLVFVLCLPTVDDCVRKLISQRSQTNSHHTILPYNMCTRSPLYLFTFFFSPYLGGQNCNPEDCSACKETTVNADLLMHWEFLRCSHWRHWAHLLMEFCLPADGYTWDRWWVHSCNGTGASADIMPCTFPHLLARLHPKPGAALHGVWVL